MMIELRAGQKKDPEEGLQENRPNKATGSWKVRARWQLLYTLVNNPSLLGSRKHFQTLQTSESVLNGTPRHRSKKGSNEGEQPEAEQIQTSETSSHPEQTE
ncbi:receptor for retinol uptake stra6 [Nematolebias whitei]|uniref:receptor for retinol uptake stra6 n=1 Tax=Nematolebias whitei TaxID=451745 RepID=UPI001897F0C4|nr:receptor for retinol uptake stra6 [Nematolebias whitei]